jgi:NTP pyrophosphatase (non-canonical NTP hydrolase)
LIAVSTPELNTNLVSLLSFNQQAVLRQASTRDWLLQQISDGKLKSISRERLIDNRQECAQIILTILANFVVTFGTTGSMIDDLRLAKEHFVAFRSEVDTTPVRGRLRGVRHQHPALWGVSPIRRNQYGRYWWFRLPAKEIQQQLGRFTASPAGLDKLETEQYWQELLREASQNGGQAVISCRHKTKTPNLCELRGVDPSSSGWSTFSLSLHRTEPTELPTDASSDDYVREQAVGLETLEWIGQVVDRLRQNTQAYVRAWDLAQQEPVDISEQNLQALQRLCHQEAKDRGWHEKPREIGTMIALIHSELSEALEGARKGTKDDKLPERDSLEVELADAVIRILDLAGREGLDLMGAMQEKLQYNRTRADHQRENREAPGGKKW